MEVAGRLPTGVYKRIKIVSEATRIKQSKSAERYIASLTLFEKKERCKSFQRAGTKAGQTLEGRKKSSDAQKEWWANNASEEEKAKRILQLLIGAQNRWDRVPSKNERREQLASFTKAGNKAYRKKLAEETKEERLVRLESWIKAGQEASQANPSSIEKLIWKELDKLKINYEIQIPFAHYKFIVDIYILSRRIIIECNGSFWHNYKIFPEKEIRDSALQKYADRNGYKIMWLQEVDIRKDPKRALEDGFKKLGVII